MKTTGMVFTGNHPQLVIDGTKTMTRRTRGLNAINTCPDAWVKATHISGSLWGFTSKGGLTTDIKCPYGQVGDLIRVRETLEKRSDGYTIYAAGKEQVLIGGSGINEGVLWEWAKTKLSSRFMPNWASRSMLEILGIRAERVQDISKMDAKAEGSHFAPNYLESFRDLWDSLNAKRGFGWSFNPWVWVILFRLH